MMLFPFYSAILKTSLTRSQVSEAILENTFLSDEGYKRTDDKKKFFYGNTSPADFTLEILDSKGHLASFYNGTINGVENEIYVFLNIQAFRYRRIYAVLVIFIVTAFSKLTWDLYSYGINTLFQTTTFLFLGIIVFLVVYLFNIAKSFKKKLQSSIDFFRGMLEAETIDAKEVPIIFKL